jgi:hypothetical protein
MANTYATTFTATTIGRGLGTIGRLNDKWKQPKWMEAGPGRKSEIDLVVG